jgi:hypothetical protein
MTTSHHYKIFYKEFCTQKMKASKTMGGQTVTNHRQTKGKKVESNIDSAAHNETIKQKQLNSRNHHIPINTTTEC